MVLGAGGSGSFIVLAFLLPLHMDDKASSGVSLCSSRIFFRRVSMRSASSIYSIVIVLAAKGDAEVGLDSSAGVLLAVVGAGAAIC